ncbi:hydroxyethylthiazole kinase [Crassaminicella profunda]|uniref:hydroxyethylthiazole kinase n=1 Tax=Crassaminicella profunda TaxID=1286698 RepID=UPI001CA6AAB6|nr:hydroxyethylthiazole kinase [Crassaminicella profunda]QZY55938.1 hydroxyethylthiazole kinase [Crassaminicella profunda]
MFEKLLENLEKNPPLVHHITNYVTVNDCANIVLAAGGSPLMADDIEEVEDIVAISSVLYINIGTLNKRTIGSMIKAGEAANEKGIPVILDPVGVGASTLRNEAIKELMEKVRFSVIKGNMSEIKALYTHARNTGGVDVQEDHMIHDDNLDENIEFAKGVARKFSCIIAITGTIDIISDGQKTCFLRNGHPMMAKITGTGCMSGSVIATYCAANKENYLEATITAIAAMGICGEMAYERVVSRNEGSSSFRSYLIDAMSLMDRNTLKEGAKIEFK